MPLTGPNAGAAAPRGRVGYLSPNTNNGGSSGKAGISAGINAGQQASDNINAFGQAFGALYPQYAVPIGGLSIQQQQLHDQYNNSIAGNALTAGSLQSDYNFGLQGNALDQAAIGLDRQRLGLQTQGNQIDQASLAAQKEFARRQLEASQMNALRGGVMRTIENNSNAIGNGAWFAPRRGTINANIAADTRAQSDAAQLSYDKALEGYSTAGAHLALDDQSIALSNQQLDLKSKELGISADQLKARLSEGLQKLGLDNQISLQQLMAGLGSNNLAYQEIMGKIVDDALQMSNLVGSGTAGAILQNMRPYGG